MQAFSGPPLDLWPGHWPDDVRDAVTSVVGDPRRIEGLSGLSGREVRRIDGDRGRVVVKRDVHARELAFYRDVAPRLDGVSVPVVHRTGEVDGVGWLVLEHLPRPLPDQAWQDRPIYDVLAALHTNRSAYEHLAEPFLPRWPDAMTWKARRMTGLDLTAFQYEARRLLDGDTPVSADPNLRNWGMRDDLRPTLFDWERAGLSTPGLDVAIVLPGLPRLSEAELAVSLYDEARAALGEPLDVPLVPRALLVLKLWTAVELLHEDRADDTLHGTQDWLAQALPAWVESWA